MELENWRDKAACKNHTDLFFSNVRRDGLKALYLCKRCPVRQECENFANQFTDVSGIFGGKLYRKKVEAKVPPRRLICGTVEGYQLHKRNGEFVCVECDYANKETKRSMDYLWA